MNPILVTGATGNVGAEIVRLLVEQGYPVKAAMRDVQGAEERFGEGTDLIDYVSFNFGRPETYEAAFRGVKAMFLMRPPAVADASKLNAAVDAAKVAGVQHVVFLSLQGVEKNPVVPHAKTEKYLKSSGLTYTFLRASFFMQNLDTTHRKDIAEYGEIFVPAGRGKTSFIDVRDIAAVAVKALTEEGHENRAYELTGADALDYFQVADIFTEVLNQRGHLSQPVALALLAADEEKRTGGPLYPGDDRALYGVSVRASVQRDAGYGAAFGAETDLGAAVCRGLQGELALRCSEVECAAKGTARDRAFSAPFVASR